MKKILSIILSVTLVSFTANAGDFVLNEYNVVTINDFTFTSHVEGKTFVGRDLNISGTPTFGQNGIKQNSNVDVLTVAGDLNITNSNINTFKNNIVIDKDNNNITVEKINNDQTKVNGAYINATVIEESNLDAIRDDYAQQLKNASQAFASLDGNSEITNDLNFTIDPTLIKDDYAVFSIDGENSIFNDVTSNISLNGYTNDLSDLAGIIINVSGTNIDFSSGSNMTGMFDNIEYREKIIWNFYEAEIIELNAQPFMGTLLAPLATVTTAGNIYGSVGVDSLISTGEIHFPLSTVTPPTTTPPGAVEVPEPTSLFLMVMAIVGILVERRTLV